MTHHHTDPHEPAWVHGHAHEPNPAPPSLDSAFCVQLPGGKIITCDVADLQKLATTTVANCTIVSTGHGTSGPFTFSGVRLRDFLDALLPTDRAWQTIDVISEDGFGTRLTRLDILQEPPEHPTLLTHTLDGEPLTRAKGLVRLIVPTETTDALRQVKWVAQIIVYAEAPTH
jgi:DMSO/TMAO reductase YedYZ molybdopterin-dependent catalytic subunit